MLEKILFVLLILFTMIRFVYSGTIFTTIYTLLLIFVPLIYLWKKKGFYLFNFNIKDSIQSIGLNTGISVVFVCIIMFISLFFNNINWLNLLSINFLDILKILVIAFFQEMFFRYFVQENMVKYTNKILGILLTSLIFAITAFPPISISIIYLIMSLYIGWIFENTKDIYGATFANFIVSLIVFVMV